MFGAPCMKSKNGKVAVILWEEGMLFKLNNESIAKALTLSGSKIGSHLYAPEKTMKGWVSIPLQHSERWLEFATRAIHFAEQINK